MGKNEHRPMTESGFLELRAAVVRKACDDYLAASDGYAKSVIREWFRSDVFPFWCDADPNAILKRLDVLRRRTVRRVILDEE